MGHLVSANDIQKAAEERMLGGRKPETKEDWALCANFWACNIEKGVEVPATSLLGLILDCPLSREDLVRIAEFQARRKP